MPQPGWYDDPDGTPQRLRWWDGTRWTEHIHGGAQPDAPGTGGSSVAPSPKRGPWPWIGLGLVTALVGALVVGLVLGLFGLREPDRATPSPAESPSPAASARPSPRIASSPQPSVAKLPPATAAPHTGGPVVRPTPMPSIPATPPPAADLGCPPASDPTALSDGRVTLTLPTGWAEVDSLAWLECTRSVASTTATATVTLGVSPFPADDLQAAAEAAWGIALLDAAIPQPLTQTSTPVQVADMEGWMVTGTMSVEDRLDELTVIAIGSGAAPTIIVTSAGAQDEGSRAMISEILATVRRA